MRDGARVPPVPVDTRPYERRIVVREATGDDVDGILELMRACYPWVDPRNRERIQAQVRRFPQGQLVAVRSKRIIGLAASMRLDLDDVGEDHSWKAITDDGAILKHDDEGPDLYGVDLMVHPDSRRMRIGHRLYEVRRDLARALNVRRIVFGGRMPGYQDHTQLSPEKYVDRVQAGRLKDPTLSFQFRQGFRPLRVLRDYLPWDKESGGHAVLMEWRNLDHVAVPGQRIRRVHAVRVCVVQYDMGRIRDWQHFADRCGEFVSVAADYDADFVVFPELFTLQNCSYSAKRSANALLAEQAARTPAYLDLFARLARRRDVNIIAGTQPVAQSGRLYNVAFLFRRDGTIAQQPKIHITPGERDETGFIGGDAISVFDTDCCRIGIPVCYDIEFPEHARIAVDAGARVLFVPYSTRDRQGHLRITRCAQARAIENQVFVVTAGTVGTQPAPNGMDIHYAQSGVYTPSDFSFARDGIQAECSVNEEMVLVADLDLEQLRRSRHDGTVRPWVDRRKDLYRLEVHAATPLVVPGPTSPPRRAGPARGRTARTKRAAGRGDASAENAASEASDAIEGSDASEASHTSDDERRPRRVTGG
jgi:predicted amidohydrolase/ribosomal protein S18 acetylase RimI-like enzyme